jgi:WD40 repeat protein
MKYDAFISYRHTPLDMEMAKKVHTGLETYHVPAAVQKKTGKKKIKRVFRDQEELPIGSDLNDNISGALEQSEWLIVICSPNTPESYWVLKEIETFISMHGRDHILAVLIEGEPNESFPKLLLEDENGNPVEPLAADVRGVDARERNKKFKTEILRLAAPVLGCSYDDLRQRHKERIIKRTITLVSAGAAVVALAGAAFGVYNANVAAKMKALADEKAQLADEKSQLAEEKTQLAEDILKEYREKQENQARFYAEKALSLLAEGKRDDAALVAMEALPSEENDRPYVGEAEYALAQVMYAYNTGNFYSADRSLKHDTKVQDSKINADKTVFLVRDSAQNVYAWDAETFELKTKIPGILGDDDRIDDVEAYDADADGIYIVTDYGLSKYGYDGSTIYSKVIGEDIPNRRTLFTATIDAKHGLAALVYYEYERVEDSDYLGYFFNNDLMTVADIFDLKTGELKDTYVAPEGYGFGYKAEFSYEGKYLLVQNNAVKGEKKTFTLFNIEDGSSKLITASEHSVYNIEPLIGDDFLIATGNDIGDDPEDFSFEVSLIDSENGIIKWTTPVPSSYSEFWITSTDYSDHSYDTPEGEHFDEIVVTNAGTSITIDRNTGKVIATVAYNSYVNSVILYKSNGKGIAGLEDGTLYEVDFHTGEFTGRSLTANTSVLDMVGFGYYIAISQSRSSEILLVTSHQASDLEELVYEDFTCYLGGISDDGKYLIGKYFDGDSLIIYDNEGNKVYTFTPGEYLVPDVIKFVGDTMIYVDGDGCYKVDVAAGKEEKVIYEDIKEFFSMSEAYVTDNGKYALSYGYRRFILVDLEKMEPVLLCDGLDEVEGSFYRAVVSEDGKYIYIAVEGSNIVKIDVGAQTVSFLENEKLRQISDASISDFLAITEDGKKAAMVCADGYVRVFDTTTGEIFDEMPLESRRSMFVSFIDNDKKLVVQGDDYTVKIRDLETKEYIRSVKMEGMISKVEEKDGMVGLSGSLHACLLEGENYAKVADVVENNGVYYSIPNKKFYISTGRGIYTIGYKDYKTLTEMARTEFAGASLSKEERRTYNMD